MSFEREGTAFFLYIPTSNQKYETPICLATLFSHYILNSTRPAQLLALGSLEHQATSHTKLNLVCSFSKAWKLWQFIVDQNIVSANYRMNVSSFNLQCCGVFFTPFRQSVKVLLCSYRQLWSDTAGFQFWFHHWLICQFSRKDILLNARLLPEPLTSVLSFHTSFPTTLPLEDGTTDSVQRSRLQLVLPQLCHHYSPCHI